MKEQSAFDMIIEQLAGKPPVTMNYILVLLMNNGYSSEEWQQAEILLIERDLMIIDNDSCEYSLITIKQPEA
jgi:hypothetical protein